jgi:DNA-binding NarL/FixJ family response regulator
MITVSIVDDDSRLCLLVTRALAGNEELSLASTHPTAEHALLEIPLRKPDVVLMDINLPGMSGIECIRRLRGISPPVPSRILILSGHDHDRLVFEALKEGADGYLSKDTLSTSDLSDAIKNVVSGGVPMTPNIARKVLNHFRRPASNLDDLSAREIDVLDHLAQGLPYKQIASRLGISLDVVRRHIKSIYRKLQVHSRTEATVRYLRRQDR